jgi:hypothetical protein
MTNYLPVVKLSAQFVAGLGVSKIISDIIKNNVQVVTTADAVKVWTGSIVIGSMLVEQSSNHIERVTNDVTTWLENRKVEKETEK